MTPGLWLGNLKDLRTNRWGGLDQGVTIPTELVTQISTFVEITEVLPGGGAFLGNSIDTDFWMLVASGSIVLRSGASSKGAITSDQDYEPGALNLIRLNSRPAQLVENRDEVPAIVMCVPIVVPNGETRLNIYEPVSSPKLGNLSLVTISSVEQSILIEADSTTRFIYLVKGSGQIRYDGEDGYVAQRLVEGDCIYLDGSTSCDILQENDFKILVFSVGGDPSPPIAEYDTLLPKQFSLFG
jgi:hypothetical protein